MMDFLDLTRISDSFPTQCCLCDQFGTHKIPNICSTCTESLPFLEIFCKRCALPLGVSSEMCGNCITKPPTYDESRALFIYTDPVNAMIGRYKNTYEQSLLAPMTQLFLEKIFSQSSDSIRPDVLVPVPLHWRRQVHRGFNQSLEISKLISRDMGIPIKTRVLKRVENTPHQTGKNRKKRLSNLKKSFVARKQLTDLTVALVDDVVTTGATVEAASQALKKAGAKKVIVWSLARTPKNF